MTRTWNRIDSNNEYEEESSIGLVAEYASNIQMEEFLSVRKQEEDEAEADAYWSDYLTREWEERHDPHGFSCDFAAYALRMHGPCYVYRPNDFDELELVDCIDPMTRRTVDNFKKI